MTRPDREIDAYLEGQLTPEQARSLEAWICQDPANAAAFLHLVQTHQALGSLGKDNKIPRQAAEAKDDQLDPVTLASLAKMEAQAEALPLEERNTPYSLDATPQVDRTSQDASLSQALDDLRWASGKFASRLIRSPYAVASAVAAVLAIGLLVLAPWQEPTTPEPRSITEEQPEPGPVGPALSRTVATLTAERDAQWGGAASAAPATGDMLRVGDRLTLTQGFAEITTNRGAIAILEAPASIELLDNENALRLHRGKLVGICETETSQGFVVHTPHMDITDLGRRFGVQADAASGAGTVTVMEGMVLAQSAAPSPDAFEPVVLGKGQARRIDAATGVLETIALTEAPVFQQTLPHPYVAQVLADEPIAYWRFEDDAGKTIANEVSADFGLRVMGPADLSEAGVIGRAGRLSNESQPFSWFQMQGQLDRLSQTDMFTISCWYRVDKSRRVATLFSLFDRDGDVAADPFRHIAVLEFQRGDDATSRSIPGYKKWSVRAVFASPPKVNAFSGENLFSQRPYSADTWQHIALVKQGQTMRLYLDGLPVGSIPVDQEVPANGQVSLGLTLKSPVNPGPQDGIIDGQRPMNGLIDEVAIYDKALTAEQVAAHYALATENEDNP